MEWAFANGYNEHLTLDRIDPKGNYEPSNCRWTTQRVQQNNRSNNVYITYRGETKKLEDWAKEKGVSRSFLYNRYKRGWDPERIFNQPKRKSPSPNETKEKEPELSIVIRFNPKKMDVGDTLAYASCISMCYEDLDPYGKSSGNEVTTAGHKAFIYRNPTGYVIDFRK